MLNFVVIRDIYFIIISVLNDIIDILFQMFKTQVFTFLESWERLATIKQLDLGRKNISWLPETKHEKCQL